MEIATLLAGENASQIINNPRCILDFRGEDVSFEEFSHLEGVINSVVLDLFVEDVSGYDHGYSFGGGGSSSSSSSSSSASARARSMAAAAVGGVVGGALSEVGARAVSFMGTNP
jgi:hypothetical protein